MRMPIRAVVFDFDGTLVDASEAICLSFNEVLVSHGLMPWEDRSIRRMIGRPLREMFSTAHPAAAPGEIERLVAEYRAIFLPISVKLARPLPGCREAVQMLARTSKLAIATSRAGPGALRILEAMDLHLFFQAIIGIYDVERPKPDAEPVLRALERLGVPPCQAALVGDTPDDVVAGKAGGVFTIGITTGVHERAELTAAGADEVVESLCQLPELLRARPDSAAPEGGE
jgi:HAD superfamily hydrolase (TIGR01509 family)